MWVRMYRVPDILKSSFFYENTPPSFYKSFFEFLVFLSFLLFIFDQSKNRDYLY